MAFTSSSHDLPEAKEYMGPVSSQRGLSPFEIQFTLLSYSLRDLENVVICCIIQLFLVVRTDTTFALGYLSLSRSGARLCILHCFGRRCIYFRASLEVQFSGQFCYHYTVYPLELAFFFFFFEPDYAFVHHLSWQL